MISDNAEVPVHFHFDCMIRWELVSMRVNFVKSSQLRRSDRRFHGLAHEYGMDPQRSAV